MRFGAPPLRQALVLVALGAAMALGLAPLNLWFVTLPALALVIRLAAGSPATVSTGGSTGVLAAVSAAVSAPLAGRSATSQAAWAGFLAGLGYFGLGLSWIVEPFMVDAATYGWMAPFALLLMAAGGALFWAAGFGLGARLRHRLPGLVAGLTALEFIRGYALTGFPWALPGHVWVETPVAQVDALVGPFGLTLLTLAAAALAARLTPRGIGAGLGMVALGWTYGLWALGQPPPPAPGLTLRLVQPNAAQALKWDPDQAQVFFDRLMAATAAPAGEAGKVDLVIWPETALPYLVEDNPNLPALISAAAGGVPVALGLQRVERTGSDIRGYNSLRVYGAGGAVIASYDKHHLVPFGEYIPFGDIAYDWFGISAFAARAGQAFSAGPGAQVLDLGPTLGKVLPLICYEAVFPQDLRVATRPNWLLQITNDAWFGTLSGPFQHAAQARLRAIEQGLPLARVANTGVTEMVDARGRVTAALPFGTEGHLDVALPGALPAPPYARYGEAPALLLLAGLALWAMRRQSSPSP